MNIDTDPDITGAGGGQAKESVCCGSTASSGGGQTQESTCCVPTTGSGCAQTIRAGGTSAKHNLNEWVGELAFYSMLCYCLITKLQRHTKSMLSNQPPPISLIHPCSRSLFFTCLMLIHLSSLFSIP